MLVLIKADDCREADIVAVRTEVWLGASLCVLVSDIEGILLVVIKKDDCCELIEDEDDDTHSQQTMLKPLLVAMGAVPKDVVGCMGNTVDVNIRV